MKAIGRLALISVVLLVGIPAGAQNLETIYENDFDTPVGLEWSHDLRNTTPNATRTFLGRFSDDNVLLNLLFLPDHCAVTVSFDLLVIGTWEGSVGYFAGPDIWDLNASVPGDCCPVQNLLHTTFAHCECQYQAYPDTFPHAYNPGTTGADEVGTLGYDYDAVYNMSFTFYHHQDALQLSFAGSPMLQGWPDETWGIDNIVVQLDMDSCCRGVRTLPSMYNPGTPLAVAVEVNPNPGTQAYVVEEDPPMDWGVGDITEGGSVDPATGTIKWGPFFGDEPRTLMYEVYVPAEASGVLDFGGWLAVDGETEATCGDAQIEGGAYHPADVDSDWSISGAEASAYAAAWRLGEEWPVAPAVIPANFVTIAGMIWRDGETYQFIDGVSPPWVPTGGGKAVGGTIETHADSHIFSSGSSVRLSLEAKPAQGTRAYVIEETLPKGWSLVDAGEGSFDETTGTLRFGPYFGDTGRTLEYVVQAPADSHGITVFKAAGSFDGIEVRADGAWMVQSGGVRVPNSSVSR